MLNQRWFVDSLLSFILNIASSLIQHWHINSWLTTVFHRWFNIDTSTVDRQLYFNVYIMLSINRWYVNMESTMHQRWQTNNLGWFSVNLYQPLWLKDLFPKTKKISWAGMCDEIEWTLFLVFWLKTKIFMAPSKSQMPKEYLYNPNTPQTGCLLAKN